jgi:hypothetical protein
VSGPGQYFPAPTAGIANPSELPPAKIVRRSRNFKQLSCPQCGRSCFRTRACLRVLHGVGDPDPRVRCPGPLRRNRGDAVTTIGLRPRVPVLCAVPTTADSLRRSHAFRTNEQLVAHLRIRLRMTECHIRRGKGQRLRRRGARSSP